MACQPFLGYFMPKGQVIVFIIHSYLHFFVVVCEEIFFKHSPIENE